MFMRLFGCQYSFILRFTCSGKMFQPENGKIHIVAVLIAWVVEYLGLTLTSIIVVLCGVYAALRTMLEKKVTA